MGKTSSRSGEKTRAERKFDKKLQFYETVRSAVAQKSISKDNQRRKRRRQRKLKAYDLSSLQEYLPEIKDRSESTATELKLNCRRRNNLALREGNHLKAVINHPIFQSDPLAAIYQHLQYTQPATDEKPKRKDGRTGKKRDKKKKSKASTQQSMEM